MYQATLNKIFPPPQLVTNITIKIIKTNINNRLILMRGALQLEVILIQSKQWSLLIQMEAIRGPQIETRLLGE